MNYLITAALLGFSSFAQASELDSVVVFADRAEVTRAKAVPCTGGSATAEFLGLPRTLQPQTLRAETGRGAKIIGLSWKNDPGQEPTHKAAKALREQLRAIDDELAKLSEARTRIDKRLKSVDAFASYFSGTLREHVRSKRADPKGWGDILDANMREHLQADVRARANESEGRKIQRRRDRVQAQLNAYRHGASTGGLRASVSIECPQSKKPTVRLSYMVPGATWTPQYDVRFARSGGASTALAGSGTAELTISVVVRQSTGEDWSNVSLALSTAQPKLGVEAWVPRKLSVGAREVQKKKVLVQAQEKRRTLQGRSGAATQASSSNAFEDGGTSFQLKVAGRVSIAADGRPYWMPAETRSLSAKSRLVSVPKMASNVYHAVKFANPMPYALMPGPVHSYRGQSFFGKSNLEYTAPGESMEVSLGLEAGVSVTRIAVADASIDPSLFSSTKKLVQAYRVVLSNKTGRRQHIEIRENFPVSSIEDVVVKLETEKMTPGFSVDEHRGFVTWNVDLPATARKSVDMRYSVQLPETWAVSGR